MIWRGRKLRNGRPFMGSNPILSAVFLAFEPMAEMVDAQRPERCTERRGGSNPLRLTFESRWGSKPGRYRVRWRGKGGLKTAFF